MRPNSQHKMRNSDAFFLCCLLGIVFSARSMIKNNITHWRSTMNNGKGVSKAHLARRVGVSRSFVTKLENGTAQPSAEVMFRIAAYFKQRVEAVFERVEGNGTSAASKSIPIFTPTLANPGVPITGHPSRSSG